ncbi:SgrR family transcriptional regulator, partial [Vibrio sp. 10N.222.49.E5]|uniref:sigma 54-interacting transcriptional regulator n=1 Tax=Vibrio sp. 10N.222.49.E5 TaxID=3229617 RepID=UPI0035506BB3
FGISTQQTSAPCILEEADGGTILLNDVLAMPRNQQLNLLRYLQEGKIGQALSVLDHNAAKLTQVIQNYLGVQYQEGEQVIRLPYYRPLSMLNPT